MHTERTQKYLRASEIARDRKTGQRGVLSISLATWWAWVKAGKAPKPIKLSPGVTVWRQTDVIAFAESLGQSVGCVQPASTASHEAAAVAEPPPNARANQSLAQARLRELRKQRAARAGGA